MDKKIKFTKSYLAYYRVIHYIALQKVKSYNDADDICHEVFIEFYKKMDDIKNHKAWLYKTVEFKILEFYRKPFNKNEIAIDDLTDNTQLSYNDNNLDLKYILQLALSTLNKTSKEIVQLKLIYNWTDEKICKELDLTRDKVRHRLDKAIRKINNFLNKNGIRNIEDLL